ncbi:MAG: DUF1289 domain-containing protein [Methylophilaceae bacterium]
MAEEVVIESPCISVCAMDDESGFCMGCYRTLDEIQGWWDLGNTIKKKIVNEAKVRAAAAFN